MTQGDTDILHSNELDKIEDLEASDEVAIIASEDGEVTIRPSD